MHKQGSHIPADADTSQPQSHFKFAWSRTGHNSRFTYSNTNMKPEQPLTLADEL
jgi:hypothetical protein